MRKIVSNREKCNQLVHRNHEIKLGPATESNGLYSIHEGIIIIIVVVVVKLKLFLIHTLNTGSFISPMVEYMGDLIPKESHEAKFQMILPKKWMHPRLKPVVIHLAGTGDHVSVKFLPMLKMVKFNFSFF